MQLAFVVFHCHILLSLLSLFFILAVQFLFLSIFLHGCILLTFLRTFLSFISTTFPVLPVFLHVYMYVFTHAFLSFINSRFLSVYIPSCIAFFVQCYLVWTIRNVSESSFISKDGMLVFRI